MEEIQQNTNAWRKQRLGKFTSSAIADLMTASRKKDEVFGDTAKTYIEKVAAERMLRKEVIDNDELFDEYVSYMDGSNKYTEWGHQWEPVARKKFTEVTGLKVCETDCIDHPSIENLAGSPDGVITNDEGKIEGVIEIKCPKPETFIKYGHRIKNGEDLKREQKNYYWQCMNNMYVTGAEYCYFIIFCPWMDSGNCIHSIRIAADEKEFEVIKERVSLAEEEVKKILDDFSDMKLD